MAAFPQGIYSSSSATFTLDQHDPLDLSRLISGMLLLAWYLLGASPDGDCEKMNRGRRSLAHKALDSERPRIMFVCVANLLTMRDGKLSREAIEATGVAGDKESRIRWFVCAADGWCECTCGPTCITVAVPQG